jgi:serine/threonine-protein kinase RsbW
MRRRLADWLRTHDAPDDDVELVVLACSEAVANAVEHGSPDGEVQVSAAVRDGRVHLEVKDAGRWDDSPSEPHRGHGLRLIRRAMNQVRISTDAGTVVRMERALR